MRRVTYTGVGRGIDSRERLGLQEGRNCTTIRRIEFDDCVRIDGG